MTGVARSESWEEYNARASSPKGEVLSEHDAYIALNLLPVFPATLRKLLDRHGTAAETLAAVCSGGARIPTGSSEPDTDAQTDPCAAPGEGLDGSDGFAGSASRLAGSSRRALDVTDSGPRADHASERAGAAGGAFPRPRGTQPVPGSLEADAGLRLGVAGLLELARREHEGARRRGFGIMTLADEAYPSLLLQIPDPPPVLYIWGSLEPDDEVRVALVGSRRCSRYGQSVALELAADLGRKGAVVVSGMARGIDAASHAGALSAGARTIAVLGSGLERLYPTEMGDLAARIAGRGAVISEYPLRMAPLPQFFPRRNRVISGLSAGVIVVEAAFASGALVTARFAAEQNREVYAVPGSIHAETSEGTLALLAEGVAHLARDAEDVLLHLPPAFRVRLGLAASAHEQAPRRGKRRSPQGRGGFPDGRRRSPDEPQSRDGWPGSSTRGTNPTLSPLQALLQGPDGDTLADTSAVGGHGDAARGPGSDVAAVGGPGGVAARGPGADVAAVGGPGGVAARGPGSDVAAVGGPGGDAARGPGSDVAAVEGPDGVAARGPGSDVAAVGGPGGVAARGPGSASTAGAVGLCAGSVSAVGAQVGARAGAQAGVAGPRAGSVSSPKSTPEGHAGPEAGRVPAAAPAPSARRTRWRDEPSIGHPDADLVSRHLTCDETILIDDLAAVCRLPVPRLLAALSLLELCGIAEILPGNCVARARRAGRP